MGESLGERATVAVIRDGKVLLVRDVDPTFMMPGGAIEPGESPEEAAVRELREETGLEAASVEPLFVWESSTFRHHVFGIEAEGEVKIGHEISDFRWWDAHTDLPVFPHVEVVWERLRTDG